MQCRRYSKWMVRSVSRSQATVRPEVARNVDCGQDPSPCFAAVGNSQGLLGVAGLDVPPWRRQCWSMMQTPQSPSVVGSIARHNVWKCNTSGGRCGPPSQTQIRRDRSGPPSVNIIDRFAHQRATRIDPQSFRVWLCRRLFLPLPLTSRTCRCGRLLHMYGYHRAACSRAGWEAEVFLGVVGSSGVHGCVNRIVRDLDLRGFNQLDGRLIEFRVPGLVCLARCLQSHTRLRWLRSVVPNRPCESDTTVVSTAN